MHIQMRRSREECITECETVSFGEFYAKCIAKESRNSHRSSSVERGGVSHTPQRTKKSDLTECLFMKIECSTELRRHNTTPGTVQMAPMATGTVAGCGLVMTAVYGDITLLGWGVRACLYAPYFAPPLAGLRLKLLFQTRRTANDSP